MRYFINACILVLLIFVGSSCGGTMINLPDNIKNLDAGEIIISVYSGGKIIREDVVKPVDKLYKNLLERLDQNSKGWKRSYSNYVPEYIVRGKSFSIRQTEDYVVIIYEKSDGFIRLEKKMALFQIVWVSSTS